ncbi:MAG: hydrogenase maturation protease [Firmicutes bacterium]|nr:hydrogenase maturation protease [Bacillota bacterium]
MLDKTDGRVVILGIGNILKQDDGVGVRVVEAMARLPLPGWVRLVPGGVPGLHLLDEIAGVRKLIVIDATRGGCGAGTLYRLKVEAPMRADAPWISVGVYGVGVPAVSDKVEVSLDADMGVAGSAFSLHVFGLAALLRLARQTGAMPRQTVLIGVEPGNLDWGLELTQPVARQVDRVIRLALEEARAWPAGEPAQQWKRDPEIFGESSATET